MQSREYLAGYGKFAQVDPAYDQTKDDPESWNLYNYVTSNPVTHTDPDGRKIQNIDNDAQFMAAHYWATIFAECGGVGGWHSQSNAQSQADAAQNAQEPDDTTTIAPGSQEKEEMNSENQTPIVSTNSNAKKNEITASVSGGTPGTATGSKAPLGVPNVTPYPTEDAAATANKAYVEGTNSAGVHTTEYFSVNYHIVGGKWYFSDNKPQGPMSGTATLGDVLPGGITIDNWSSNHNHPDVGRLTPSKLDVFSASKNGALNPGFGVPGYIFKVNSGLIRYEASRPIGRMEVMGHFHDAAPSSWLKGGEAQVIQ